MTGDTGEVPLPAAGEPPPAPSGMLVVNKRRGLTSMTVCAVVRGKLRSGGAPRRIKVGHSGTLDPLATGVLVVLIGKATRKCNQIMEGEKRYTAGIDLSRTSTTDDLEGQVTMVDVAKIPTHDQIAAACRTFLGWKRQRPPAHSAMKVGGVRAYKLARLGEAPEMKPRFVEMIDIAILDYAWPTVTLDVRCGKGTYIRSLARDLGQALSPPTGGMLTSLERTAVGPWTIDQARTLDDLPEVLRQDDLLPVE